MKHIYKKLTIPAVAIFILSAAMITFTGCSKADSNKEAKKAETSSTKTSTFAYIPETSNIIGEINIARIAKIDSVKKQIEANKDIPYIKELKSSGMDVDNINTINFGISPDVLKQSIDKQQPSAKGVVLVQTINKVNLSKFIKLLEKNHELKFKTEKVDNSTVYYIPTKEHNGVDTLLTQLSDNLIAIGTKDMLEQSMQLYTHKGKSVLQNSKLMQVSDNAKRNDMLWIAALIPPEAAKSTDKDAPQINDGILFANYIDKSLNIGGTINCASNQDVQKILLPAQMIISLAAMNSNNTLKAEDISLKANKNKLSIDIKIPQAALENFAKSAAANATAAANNIQTDNTLTQVTNQDQAVVNSPDTGVAKTVKVQPGTMAKVKNTSTVTDKTAQAVNEPAHTVKVIPVKDAPVQTKKTETANN
ncbi:MAG TPA: hypothetical protein QF753_09865 [Victivallales bacterium]|nr:hypothetical protein [Victivallales bacterium]